MANERILYFTDKTGISTGYRTLFHQILLKNRIRVSQVLTTSVYAKIPEALKKVTQKRWGLNKEHTAEVIQVVDAMIKIAKPSMLVVSCPAVLGALVGVDNIESCRGSVYAYRGLPVAVVLPISALNTHVQTKMRDEEGVNVYKVKAGSWILQQDWGKIGRWFRGEKKAQPPFVYSVARTLDEVKFACEWLSRAVAISMDIETKGADVFISCIGYTGMLPSGEMRTFVVPFYSAFIPGGNYWGSQESLGEVVLIVREINSNNAIKILQNGGYDASHCIYWRLPFAGYYLDTLHLWHSLYCELPKRLDFITSFCCDDYEFWKEDSKGIEEVDELKRDKDMEKYWRYNALDCYYTFVNTLVLLPTVLKQEWAIGNYEKEFRSKLCYLIISLRGIHANKVRLGEHEGHLLQESEQLEHELKIMVDDPDFNPRSPAQVSQLFYEILGAKKRKIQGKFGNVSELTLRAISHDHPLFAAYAEKLRKTKQPRKTISDICRARMKTSRIRTNLNAAGTETWRCSSATSNFWDGRNLQNIPAKFRDWMEADDGYFMFDADYSQSDAVFVAYESEDEKYIETMSSGKDSHALHAAYFFRTTYEIIIKGVKEDDPFIVHPTKGIRNLTKRVVHGANFRMEGTTLFFTMRKEAVIAAAIALGHRDAHRWQDKQLIKFAQTLLDGFRKDLYPGLPAWYSRIETKIKQTRMLTNAYGMTRVIFGDVTDQGTFREGTAFFGQGDTAGNINRSVHELMLGYIPKTFRDGPNPHRNEKAYNAEKDGVQFLLQVHDSLVGQIPVKSNYVTILNNILTVMERPCIINGRIMRVAADCKVGVPWGKSMIKWNRDNPPSIEAILATRG